MFVLAEMKNAVRVAPDKFSSGLREAVTQHLERALVGKVIRDVGLCVALFDITRIQECFLLPGDGAAHTTVLFRAVVFRPFEEEVLRGRVARCDEQGVRVTLEFFDSILIPPSNLQQPCRFDEMEGTWVWEYAADDGSHDLFMDAGEPICFRVTRNTFAEVSPVDGSAPTDDADKPPAVPYVVTATISEPGLGLLSWWS